MIEKIKAKRKSVNETLREKGFWTVQLLNLQYFFKYYFLYSLQIYTFSFFLVLCKVENQHSLTKEVAPGLTTEGIMAFAIVAYIVYRALCMVVPFIHLFIRRSEEGFKARLCRVLQTSLYFYLVVTSTYLSGTYFDSIHSYDDIPGNFYFLFVVSFICYFLTKGNITRQFTIWAREIEIILTERVKPTVLRTEKDLEKCFKVPRSVEKAIKVTGISQHITLPEEAVEAKKIDSKTGKLKKVKGIKALDVYDEVQIQVRYSIIPRVTLRLPKEITVTEGYLKPMK
ncbi:hypothetical protein EWX79_12845 [Enterococcus faecalis]|nr:hypothetical protein [Enterococcus faecalis]